VTDTDRVTDVEALTVDCPRCEAPTAVRCRVPGKPHITSTSIHRARRAAFLADPAVAALRSTPTEALLRAAYSLTHQIHSADGLAGTRGYPDREGARRNAAEGRAQRDLITAEIIRRTK
jgi:hypothetical protein